MVSYQAPVLIFGLLALLVCQCSAGVHHILQECAKETGTTLDDAQNFMKTGEAPQSLKCAFACAIRKMNVMNDDGTLKIDLVLTIAPANKAEIIKQCSNFPPGDPCENSYKHFKCYLDNDNEHLQYVFNKLITDF